MKLITFIVCMFLLPLFGNTQVDTIGLPISKVIETAQKISELQESNSLKTKQIEILNVTVSKLESVNKKNESIIELKNIELDMYKSLATRFLDLPTLDEKWFETKTFVFVAGILVGGGIIYAGAVIVSTIK